MEHLYRILTVLLTMLILFSVQSFHTEGNAAGSADHEITLEENTFNAANSESMFIRYSIETCYANIHLSRLANKKAQSPFLKDIARTLESEHNNWLKELCSLAQKNNISVSPGMSNGDRIFMKHLTKQSSNEFDQQWTSILIDKHDEFIEVYERYARKAPLQKSVKRWINENIVHFRSHQDRLIMFEESLRFE